MWGGVTTPGELRAIADVADKFKIPTVKVTGGQRIDLLGVKKEDLPAVWADLNDAGMVSGHAYAKGLRTVKTCVGSEWCRFGTQDSTGLGIKIERFMWGSWAPAKVKMAVSGCPRNCAESTCKDVGVICVDSGYEIHFAGAAGLHIKGTEFLAKVATEEETLEVIAALTQLYREQGWYLERIYKWCDRVGLDAIRKQVVDDLANRKALYDRFVYSQQVLAKRSMGGARPARGRSQRVCADGGARTRMTGIRMTKWIEIGSLNDIPRLGSRVVRTRVGKHRGVPDRRRRGVRARRPLPAQGRAAVARHRPQQARHLSAA